MKKLSVWIASLLLCMGIQAQVPQLRADNIDAVLAAMTNEEKASLIVGTEMKLDASNEAMVGQTKDLVPGAAGVTRAIPRLGIPSIVLADGPAGLRISPTREGDSQTYYCTHFPIGTLLACTWNPELVRSVGAAIGNEVLEYGCDVLLAPGMNIHRNPICGRNFEYYSEDPYLAGMTASAYVEGVQSQGVGTSIKHYAANNQETNRQGNDAQISQRALREIYLRPFEMAVKQTQPWTLMTSYNRINGVYTSEDPFLLEDILRKEWGYTGTVMSDWCGGEDAVAQMHAGNDMLEPGREFQYKAILAGLANGTLSQADVDRNVRRILELIVRCPSFKKYAFSNKPDLQAHAAITRQSASEGMVLLKNEAVLPLQAGVKNVALFGNTSYDFIAGGTGSGNVNRAYTVSLTDGLQNAGYALDAQLQQLYTAYLKAADEAYANSEIGRTRHPFFPKLLHKEYLPKASSVKAAAKKCDVAIITLGRTSGEFCDRYLADFSISQEERQLLNLVSETFHKAGKRVVVVLNVGGVIETASWRDMADAILLAWQAGQEGGNSVADVLSGKANPSGRLSQTWPIHYSDHGSSANFPTADIYEGGWGVAKSEVARRLIEYTPYEEDVYVGYRWFDKHEVPVSYPFGYGLSYTHFSYSDAQLIRSRDKVVVAVRVTNTGDMAGKEVVQLYVAAPGKDMDKPQQELRAYAKTRCLAPGESEIVRLEFAVSDLCSYSETLSDWLLERGNYEVRVAANSRDVKISLPLVIR